MATFTWTLDSPTGTYKNNKLSAQIREASVVMSLFHEFVDAEPGYGKNSGETLNVTRISNIAVPSSAALSEGQPISEDAFSLSTQAITVVENGRAVPFTSLSQDLAYFDINSKVQKMLMRQMKISYDRGAAAAFKTGQVRAACTGTSAISFTTNATAGTATVAPNSYHVEQIRDYLFTNLYVDPFDGEDYICMISTKAKRSLMQDPAWIDWKKYTDPAAKYNSEIGRYENIRFIENNDTTAVSGSVGVNSQPEAIFFGSDAATIAVAQDPELRAKIPTDYGRSKGVAWYGIYAFGQIWYDSANAGEARVVYMTSV